MKKFVINTNILFSLFSKDSFTIKLISKIDFKLYSPKFCLKELIKHSKEICEKFEIPKEDFEKNERNKN